MSSINEYWATKDGMVTSSEAAGGTWCGKKFTEDAEVDNDWIVLESETKAYNANLFVLTAKIQRDLIGSTNKDYTYKIGKEYDYYVTYGVWDTPLDSEIPTEPPLGRG